MWKWWLCESDKNECGMSWTSDLGSRIFHNVIERLMISLHWDENELSWWHQLTWLVYVGQCVRSCKTVSV